MKKRKWKSYLTAVIAILIVAALVIGPFFMEKQSAASGEATIRSEQVEEADITSNICGAGTLREEDAITVSVPNGVMLEELLVENGQSVTAGTPLAKVDTLSVMNAVTQVQQTLEKLEEQMADAADQEAATEVVAQVGGRVMKVYCEEGDDAQQVMLEHGALAIVSLDGKLTTSFASDAALNAGASVVVVLGDGTELEGRVEPSLAGTLCISVTDDGPALGEQVTVKNESGTTLGTGTLKANNEWRASAYTGTIDDVCVEEGDEISNGKTICTLTDTEDSSQFQLLSAKHRAYESILTELFVLYQTKTLTAEDDGYVTVPDDTDAFLLSALQQSYSVTLLANAPTGSDEAYLNFVGVVTGREGESLSLNICPQPLNISDYLDTTAYNVSAAQMTQAMQTTLDEDTPVFSLVDGQWQLGSLSDIAVGDRILFAYQTASAQQPVWVVRISQSAPPQEGDTPGDPDIDPNQPTDPTDPSQPTDPTDPSQSTDPTDPNQPTNPNQQQTPGGASQPQQSMPSYGSSGLPSGLSGYSGMSGATGDLSGLTLQEQVEEELFSQAKTQVLTIIPTEVIYLDVTLDELDILSAAVGQQAKVTIDALPGRSFTGEVTELNPNGVNSGGNSKYSLTLTLEREENMLGGMNASAEITMETAEHIPTIPVAALVEQGTKTYVYRSYDKTEGLGTLTEVTTGVADGEKAEITSGLTLGDTVYYEYYDQVQYDVQAPSTRNGFFRN